MSAETPTLVARIAARARVGDAGRASCFQLQSPALLLCFDSSRLYYPYGPCQRKKTRARLSNVRPGTKEEKGSVGSQKFF